MTGRERQSCTCHAHISFFVYIIISFFRHILFIHDSFMFWYDQAHFSWPVRFWRKTNPVAPREWKLTCDWPMNMIFHDSCRFEFTFFRKEKSEWRSWNQFIACGSLLGDSKGAIIFLSYWSSPMTSSLAWWKPVGSHMNLELSSSNF